MQTRENVTQKQLSQYNPFGASRNIEVGALNFKKDPVVIEDEVWCVHRERFVSTIIHTTSDKVIFHCMHSTLNDHERGIITFNISPIKFLKLEGTYEISYLKNVLASARSENYYSSAVLWILLFLLDIPGARKTHKALYWIDCLLEIYSTFSIVQTGCSWK